MADVGQVAQADHNAGTLAGADLGAVLVADPVDWASHCPGCGKNNPSCGRVARYSGLSCVRRGCDAAEVAALDTLQHGPPGDAQGRGGALDGDPTGGGVVGHRVRLAARAGEDLQDVPATAGSVRRPLTLVQNRPCPPAASTPPLTRVRVLIVILRMVAGTSSGICRCGQSIFDYW
jgi:hypothetical protein